MQHKNDYSVIAYFNDETKPKKWEFVHKLNGFSMFLNNSHPTWSYINVYERRTRKYIKRFKKGEFIPAFID